jgi:hypothetical protein
MFHSSRNNHVFPRSEHPFLSARHHAEGSLYDFKSHVLGRVRVAWDTRTGLAKPVGLEDLTVALDGCKPVNERRSPW